VLNNLSVLAVDNHRWMNFLVVLVDRLLEQQQHQVHLAVYLVLQADLEEHNV
jgi:hypothetical protein